MNVSVIIITSGDRGFLINTLDSLLNQAALPHEIILVSLNKISWIPQKSKLIKICYQQKPSYGEARNIGIKNSSGDLICFTSDDCIVDKNWIKNIIELHKNHEKQLGICGRIIDRSNRLIYRYANDVIWTEMEHFNKIKAKLKFPDRKDVIISTGGENLSYKREVFESYAFDPSLEAGEDFALNSQLAIDDKPLLFSENLVVYHHNAKTTIKSFMKQYFIYGRGMMDLHKKGGFSLGFYPSNVTGFILCLLSVMFFPIYIVAKYHNKKALLGFPLIFLKELSYRMGQVSVIINPKK